MSKLRRVNVAADGLVLSASPSLAHERELSRLMVGMLRSIERRFRTSVISKITRKVERRFADDGSYFAPEPVEQAEESPPPPPEDESYAEWLLLLLLLLFRRTKKQYSDDVLEREVGKVLNRVDRLNNSVLTERLAKETGLSYAQLKPDEATQAKIDTIKLQAVEAVKQSRDATLEAIKQKVLEVVATGGTADEIAKEVAKVVEKRTKQAERTAQHQIDFANSMITKVRAQGIGIKQAVWVTMRDERVRRTHRDRDGKLFDLAKGCYSKLDDKWIYPSQEWNCRCVYRLVVPRSS